MKREVTSNDAATADVLVTANRIQQRYCVSRMTLWRWLQDTKLDFPCPVLIRGRRYWRLSELTAWESNLEKGGFLSAKDHSVEDTPVSSFGQVGG